MTQFYDKKPLHPQKNPKFTVTTQKRPKDLDYTTIADRLRTVRWVTIVTQRVWLNRFTGSNLPYNRTSCVIKRKHISKFVNNPPYKGREPTANESGEAIKIITQTCKVIKT